MGEVLPCISDPKSVIKFQKCHNVTQSSSDTECDEVSQNAKKSHKVLSAGSIRGTV